MSTLNMRIVTYLIEHLGKFEFIFETLLDNESGDLMSSFDEKKRHRKSHAWAPLRLSGGRKRKIFNHFHGKKENIQNLM